MAAPRAKLNTLLVSAGSITPSSHILADAYSGRPSSSYLHGDNMALESATHKPHVKQSKWAQLLQSMMRSMGCILEAPCYSLRTLGSFWIDCAHVVGRQCGRLTLQRPSAQSRPVPSPPPAVPLCSSSAPPPATRQPQPRQRSLERVISSDHDLSREDSWKLFSVSRQCQSA